MRLVDYIVSIGYIFIFIICAIALVNPDILPLFIRIGLAIGLCIPALGNLMFMINNGKNKETNTDSS